MTTNQLTIGSLFSGIGGLDVAAERAFNGRVAWHCEIEPHARKVLQARWPDATLHDDVRTLTKDSVLDSLANTSIPGVWMEAEMGRGGWFKKLDEQKVAEAVRMYERGMSCAPIAEFFGVSRAAMHSLLSRRTTMRPQRRSGKDNHFYRGSEAHDPAQNLAEKAIQRGVLVNPQVCEECGASYRFKDGRTAIQAHHDDYNKPLDVRWLCQKCHHDWHKHNTAIAKEVPAEAPQIDVICGGFP